MSDARKQRLTREALGRDSGTPSSTADLTPRIAYIGLILLVVAAITGGGPRMEGDVPLAIADRGGIAHAAPAPARDAVEGNVQDLTY